MRTAGKTTFVLLAVVALFLGAFSAAALAAKKKDTVVNFFGDPSFNPGGEVKAKGSLHTAPACLPQRVVKLQVLDAKGDVIMAIDEHATKKNTTSGNWSVSGHLPKHLPAGKSSVRVKVKKRTAGKFQCKAGFSVPFPIPVPTQ